MPTKEVALCMIPCSHFTPGDQAPLYNSALNSARGTNGSFRCCSSQVRRMVYKSLLPLASPQPCKVGESESVTGPGYFMDGRGYVLRWSSPCPQN